MDSTLLRSYPEVAIFIRHAVYACIYRVATNGLQDKGYECDNDKLIGSHILVTLVLITLICNPLVATPCSVYTCTLDHIQSGHEWVAE